MLMTLRIGLVSLLVAATVTFVVGVAIERGDEANHHDAGAEVVRGAGETVEEPHSETGEEPGAEHASGIQRPDHANRGHARRRVERPRTPGRRWARCRRTSQNIRATPIAGCAWPRSSRATSRRSCAG